jgi:hypothetical protein
MYPVAFAMVALLANGKDMSIGEIIKARPFQKFRSTASFHASR